METIGLIECQRRIKSVQHDLQGKISMLEVVRDALDVIIEDLEIEEVDNLDLEEIINRVLKARSLLQSVKDSVEIAID